MIEWKRVQARIGVEPDGDPGRITYRALLEEVTNWRVPLSDELGRGLAIHVPRYRVDARPERLAAFLAQTAHESGGFRYMKELGGPAYFARYDGRRDLGNSEPGDGPRFAGRGLIQLTGRANYRDYGEEVGLDLIARPELAAEPATAVLLALEFWRRKGLNALADAEDVVGITRRINGGDNGLAERRAFYARTKALLEWRSAARDGEEDR